jgi:uncharacterized protein YecE (DUF72 family)
MIRYGTCSWKYDSWQGIIYSANARNNYLAEYSQKLSSVEIDQWFWSLFGPGKTALPSPATVKEYAESVPDNFRFTIKVPNTLTLTHYYRKSKTDPLEENPHFLSNDFFKKFADLLEPLHDKIALLMFQFEYLNKQKMESQGLFLNRFSRFLAANNQSLPIGLEIRNPNYLNRPYFDFLQRNGLSHVFCQGYYMPPVWQSAEKYLEMLQSPVVIRLMGPDRSDIEEVSKGNWNKLYEPKDDELAKITEVIRKMKARNLDIYINVNNHYEGSAPLTIDKVKSLIE